VHELIPPMHSLKIDQIGDVVLSSYQSSKNSLQLLFLWNGVILNLMKVLEIVYEELVEPRLQEKYLVLMKWKQYLLALY